MKIELNTLISTQKVLKTCNKQGSKHFLSTNQECHQPVEIEYKASWAIKKLNLDLGRDGLKRVLDINELEEFQNDVYLNSKIAKDRLKKWHDQIITRKTFKHGDQVLLYDSKLHLFPGKLKSIKMD